MTRPRTLPFPGDSESKQVARMFLYKHAKKAPVQGHAVTLAGTDPASEILLLRNYLRWPVDRTWFVDKSKAEDVSKALRIIRKSWPGVRTEQEDLKDVLERIPGIGFANLDFMGAPLSDSNILCLRSTISLMLPGAILGFTWIRGREHALTRKSSRRLWRLGKGFYGNERRWAGVLKAIDNISRGSVLLIDRWEYQNNHSPMAVSVFKKIR